MSDGARVGVVACGALAAHVTAVARRRGWAVDVHPLPPELHNRPGRIAPAVAARLGELRTRYERLAVAYADCGTGGALDEALAPAGIERLAGEHCYDVLGGAAARDAIREEPGTYLLTDFLVRAFDRLVWRGLGLDRHPELLDAYFRNYTRVVYLAQRPDGDLLTRAAAAARRLGLPLEVRDVGESGLERELGRLVGGGGDADGAR
jgi:hypothetical protein